MNAHGAVHMCSSISEGRWMWRSDLCTKWLTLWRLYVASTSRCLQTISDHPSVALSASVCVSFLRHAASQRVLSVSSYLFPISLVTYSNTGVELQGLCNPARRISSQHHLDQCLTTLESHSTTGQTPLLAQRLANCLSQKIWVMPRRYKGAASRVVREMKAIYNLLVWTHNAYLVVIVAGLKMKRVQMCFH